jgi:glutamate 5-kinase
MALYDDLFGQFNQPVAQILLTRNDLADVSYIVFITISNIIY